VHISPRDLAREAILACTGSIAASHPFGLSVLDVAVRPSKRIVDPLLITVCDLRTLLESGEPHPECTFAIF